jgi:hypothetical protein
MDARRQTVAISRLLIVEELTTNVFVQEDRLHPLASDHARDGCRFIFSENPDRSAILLF